MDGTRNNSLNQIELMYNEEYDIILNQYQEYPSFMNVEIPQNMLQFGETPFKNQQLIYKQIQNQKSFEERNVEDYNSINPFLEENALIPQVEVNQYPYLQQIQNNEEQQYKFSNMNTFFSGGFEDSQVDYAKFDQQQNNDGFSILYNNQQIINNQFTSQQLNINNNPGQPQFEKLESDKRDLHQIKINAVHKQQLTIDNQKNVNFSENPKLVEQADQEESIIKSQIAKQKRIQKKQQKLKLYQQQQINNPKRNLRSQSKKDYPQLTNQQDSLPKDIYSENDKFKQALNEVPYFIPNDPAIINDNYNRELQNLNAESIAQQISESLLQNNDHSQFNCQDRIFLNEPLQEELLDQQQQFTYSFQQSQTNIEEFNKSKSIIEEFEDNDDGEGDLSTRINNNLNRKNIVKNIMSSFQRFITSTFEDNKKKNKDQKQKDYLFQKTRYQVYFSSEQENQISELTEIIKNDILKIYNQNNVSSNFKIKQTFSEFMNKFNRYFMNRSYNNFTIKLLVKHRSFGQIFKYYLQNFFKNWLLNINVSNKPSHIQISNILIKSFSNEQLLNNITNHKK